MAPSDDVGTATLDEPLVPCPHCKRTPGKDPGDDLIIPNGCRFCHGARYIAAPLAEEIRASQTFVTPVTPRRVGGRSYVYAAIAGLLACVYLAWCTR